MSKFVSVNVLHPLHTEVINIDRIVRIKAHDYALDSGIKPDLLCTIITADGEALQTLETFEEVMIKVCSLIGTEASR